MAVTYPLVGLIVEGESDIYAIPQLLRDTNIRLTRPIKFNGQPESCNDEMFSEFIRSRIVPRVRHMMLKRVSLVIIVIDRENREQCPGSFAGHVKGTILDALEARYQYANNPPISVVCADRKLENWLVADPKGILSHNYISKDISRAIGVKADGKDAIELLERAYVPGRYYHKLDAPKLASKVRAMTPEVRRRSRSLDKLLRECGVSPLESCRHS